jgi:hypothetical protein
LTEINGIPGQKVEYPITLLKMNGKLNDKQVQKEAKELEKQALKKLKDQVPGLIKTVQQEMNWTMQNIADYLNEKLKEKIRDYEQKTKNAFDKWLQGFAPNNKEVKIVVDALNELLKPSIQDLNVEYETYRSAIEQVFLPGIIRNIPQDLIDFWNKQYKSTFQLYNWQGTFFILKPAELRQELTILDNSFPNHTRKYSLISTLLPFAKETESSQGSYLAYGFDNTDKDFGVYLWNINGYYEYPVFIANSVTDLIDHHIFTLEKEDNLHFDSEKYLNETLEKNMKGDIILLNFNTLFNDGNDINMHLKKFIDFYETAIKRGTIKFEASRELITVSTEDLKEITYNKNGDLFLFIEKVNDELNRIDKSNFCRPKYYGYYLINREYLAYLRLDIATDLIQKGYINSRFKMLPMLAFYNPKLPNTFNEFRTLAELDRLENQKINLIQ